MYSPIQVPYIVNPIYQKYFKYPAIVIPSLQDFVICLWEHQSLTQDSYEVNDLIIPDGCIDLFIDFKKQSSNFQVSVKQSMIFIAISEFKLPFNLDYFFSLSYSQQKEYFIDYLHQLIEGHTPNQFIKLIDRFSQIPASTIQDLCQDLVVGTRQCQQLFKKYYGISPQLMLLTLRFQYCLKILTDSHASEKKLIALHYYDQSHLIKDFKKHIGFTPLEFAQLCKEFQAQPLD
ncbi:helix-turn-helix domain-containing protein [Enterococcus spodopteracolus]|uniref:helix-turn-helix domain-containing protein n=1 Tax=Enterococcus spodopteracolus TaxID=3034501 RepID=UPI00264747E0|nr:helix-turn-helix domain-containing protein [Enterococcus spodopteracolus]